THLPAPSGGLRQDNSRIDLRNPFIGSGGWLGVIVRAEMKIVPQRPFTAATLLVPRTLDAIPAIQHHLEKVLGEDFTAFESMDDACLHLVADTMPEIPYLLKDED